MRVLLVEDDPMIGEAIQGALKDAAYATDWVQNGQTALTTLDCHRSMVQLSNREFSLLQALLVRPGAILSRSELEDRIYGWGDEVESNAVDFLIHSLRRKLGSDVIKNVRGLGWMVSKNA